MSSSIDTRCIRVESVLLALGILAFLQLSLMSDEDPCRWICWARLATACGVLGLCLGAVILFDHCSRQAEPPRRPRGPQIGPRDSYVKGLNTSSPGFGESHPEWPAALGGEGDA